MSVAGMQDNQYHQAAADLNIQECTSAGTCSGVGVPQLHRHSLLPAVETLPTDHAAPHEVPLQGL